MSDSQWQTSVKGSNNYYNNDYNTHVSIIHVGLPMHLFCKSKKKISKKKIFLQK